MMDRKFKLAFCFGVFLLFLACSADKAQAAYGPKAYITESVTQDYWWNGSAKGALSMTGAVEVSVPNDWDVPQYVRVNLTGANMWTSTNLRNSTTYDNVVHSDLRGP